MWWPFSKKAEVSETEYTVNDLIVPRDIDSLPMLSVAKGKFIAPRLVYTMDYCVQPQSQGTKPWCAAYAACGFASNILWRKNDIPTILDAAPIYQYAKTVDGDSSAKGTTLEAVLKALLHFEYFRPDICSIKIIRNIEQVKYAIHKFGCCLIGVNVSKEWYRCNINKSTISGKTNNELIGGHAVHACGYDDNGLYVQNSWGEGWGENGLALITWNELARTFLYGAVLNNCLYDMKIN